jgi:hypothetical protein
MKFSVHTGHRLAEGLVQENRQAKEDIYRLDPTSAVAITTWPLKSWADGLYIFIASN